MRLSMVAWSSYVPRGVELVLLALLGWVVVIWCLQYNDTELLLEPLTDVTIVENTAMPKVAIPKVALFGKRKLDQQHAVVSLKAAVVSRLKVKLLGTVVAGKRSAAVMKVGNSAETTFFLGDSLQAGVFLKMVETDAVVVDHQGKLERISLSKGKAIQRAKARLTHRQPLMPRKGMPR